MSDTNPSATLKGYIKHTRDLGSPPRYQNFTFTLDDACCEEHAAKNIMSILRAYTRTLTDNGQKYDPTYEARVFLNS